MKSLSLKKVSAAILFSLVASSSAFANTATPLPKDAGAKMQRPAPIYPGATWNYALPAISANTLPTLDKNTQQYLPYLPWIGQNIALLVNYADFFYQLQQADINGATGPYNSIATATSNTLISQTREKNMGEASRQTSAELANQLTFDPLKAASLKLAQIPGTDSVAPCTGAGCPTAPSNEQFNADSIFGSLGYTDGQATNINSLIHFLANLTQPLPDPGLSTNSATRKSQLQRADVQNYLLMIRTLVSLQSMALSNFNFLAEERKIIAGLGEKANMKLPPDSPGGDPKPVKDASQLQLEQYLINNRLNNPNWYASMNTASPAAVQREMLYVLAETQRQLFELRMVNERMLATMSTMQMALTQMSRSNIQVSADRVKGSLEATGSSGG